MNKKDCPTYIYLHGFASSPGSTKARYFVSKLEELGIEVLLPDLNGGSFRELTLTNQLRIIDACFNQCAKDVVIVGSSMGGLLATLTSAAKDQVQALVLLAPGFGLPKRWNEMLGADGLNTWRAQGYIEIFNHAMNREAKLDFGFILDAEQYRTEDLKVDVPTLVFHGKNDETVPVRESITFADQNRGLVELHLLDDGHDLISPLEFIWNTTYRFLTRLNLAPDAAIEQSGIAQHKKS